jgi:hypothetical protein
MKNTVTHPTESTESSEIIEGWIEEKMIWSGFERVGNRLRLDIWVIWWIHELRKREENQRGWWSGVVGCDCEWSKVWSEFEREEFPELLGWAMFGARLNMI